MNYSRFKDDLRAFGSVLSDHGIPNHAIDDILSFAEQTGIIAEAKEKNDRQFEMQYRECGSTVMAQRLGISPQAVRKRFQKLCAQPKETPEVARQVA
jgi:hypothetical protein